MTARPSHPPAVYIEWRDAADLGMRWNDRQEIAKGPETHGDLITTVGFIVRETDDWLVLAAMWRGQMDQAANAFMVPKACIVRRSLVRREAGYDFEPKP